MNILYFGPYKYNDFLGICSRALIDELSQIDEAKLYTKPIFLNNLYANRTMVNYSAYNKKLPDQNFDYIIQHCPIDMVALDHNLSKKNIYIPICDYGINVDYTYNLHKFDHICVDNLTHYKIFDYLELNSSIIDYNIPKKTNDNLKINIGLNRFKTKFYFIGSYQQNINILNKLIVAFILAFRDNPNVSLTLLLNEDQRESVNKSINKTISSLYEKLNFNSKIPPIQIITQTFSIEDLQLIHNNFDIFIDLSDEYETGLNYGLAKKYNKTLLSIQDIKSVIVPYLDGYAYSTRYKFSVLTTSLKKNLQNKLLEFKKNKTPEYINTTTIKEIINEAAK